ncbi:MAG: helix-turn-helix domain-containing protein [Sedimentibacter sp.]
MANELLKHVGSQIKMFRKIKKLTIDDLAKLISKSKSTVSKYESGEIAIDVQTLYDIANALNINIINLIDYEDSNKVEIEPQSFWQADHLYLYHQSGKKIYSSYIQLRIDDANKKIIATLYYKIENFNDLKNCDCVYQGNMNHHENILNFNLKNCLYDSEFVLMNFFVPMKKTTALSGLISGLEGVSLRPSSYKVILSKRELAEEEQMEMLQLSKEVIKRLRDEHVFRVDD